MFWSRGGGSQIDRVCLIVPIRWREWSGLGNIVEYHLIKDVLVEETYKVDDEAYLGVSLDRSLLVSYEDRVAQQIWNRVVSNNDQRDKFKFIGYLLKMVNWY